jgi:medium-chain acyl-[acyl-carrier-protein] hydrolase
MTKDTNNPLFHTDPTRIRGYEIDLAQQASLPSMIRMMHEAAMQHVLKLKISAKELAPMNLGWVLHQQKIEIFRRPSLGEHLKILTHPSGKSGIMTYRDFHFYDQNEQLLAQASTAWLLFNTSTRRIARFPPFIDEWLEKANELEKLPRPERELPELTHADFRMQQQVRYNELDFNAHLSNYYYARWAMDCLPREWLEGKQVKSLNMKFQEECYLDDRVEVLAQEVDENTLIHSLRKGDGELVRAVSVWE